MDVLSPHNLAEQPNALIGRDQELQAARQLILSHDARLLTLTGPPGVGKTRLAMAVAESVLESFPEGVWFVDLAPLRDPALVGSEIACTLGIAERHDESVLDCLATYLRGRRVLLFLDNFEGVVQAAPWVGKLVERTPGLKILTTSRERLRLRWERMLLVPPLALPVHDQKTDVATLAQNPSVALFVQRATAVDADFTLSSENAPIIAALCTHLDGLPLAIELAAAHADVLSPAEILSNMDDRFHLLGMGPLDLPERHQTLKAAIDWSYEFLPSGEAQFLRRLAVFSGGFTLAAAESIGESGALGLDGLASLIALVEKSLVIRVVGLGGETRFSLLESIRDYLMDRLRTSGEVEGARRRHALFFLDLAEHNYAQLKSGNQKARFDVLEIEHDNLREALQWSLDVGERRLGARIAAALWNFWWLRGHVREGTQWLQTFLESGIESQDETRLRVQEGAGTLQGWQGNFERGRSILMQALRLAEERQDRTAIARILFRLGMIFWVNGKTEETDWLAERIETWRRDADPWELAHAFLTLGNLYFESGRDDPAEKAFARSLECFQFAEERHVAILAESKLALVKDRQGDGQAARKEMMQALEAVMRSSDLYVITYCVDDALQLATRRDITQERDVEKTARIMGAVNHWREMLSLRRTPREKSEHHWMTESLRRRLGEPAFSRAWKEGQSLAIESVIQQANELLEASASPGSADVGVAQREDTSIRLSERERQVIGCVAEGLSNQEIADRLFITERTVRFHLTSVFNKLGASNRAQAVSIANRRGLL